MTQQNKPTQRSALDQLRDFLQLPPTMSKEDVIKEANKTQQNLKQLSITQQEKFKVAFEAYKREIGQDNKEFVIAQKQQLNWMRKEEQLEKQQALFAAYILIEKKKDREEQEEEEFEALDPDDQYKYKPVENPQINTSPSLVQKCDDLNDLLKLPNLPSLMLVRKSCKGKMVLSVSVCVE